MRAFSTWHLRLGTWHWNMSRRKSIARTPVRPAAILRALALGLLLAVVAARMLVCESFTRPWTLPLSVAEDGRPMPWVGPLPSGSIMLFVMVLLAGLLWTLAEALEPRKIVGRWGLLFVGMFAAAGVVSTMAASNRAAARDNSLQFLGLLLTFWLLLQLLSSKRLRQLAVATVLAAGIAFAVQVFTQHYVDNPRFVSEQWPNERARFFAEQGWQPDDPAARQYEERVLSAEDKGFAVNANIAAALLAVVSLAGVGWAVQKIVSPRVPLRWLFAGLAGLAAGALLFALLLTGSRGGIAGACFGLLLFVLLAAARHWAWRHRRGLAVSAVAAVILMAAGTAFVAARPEPTPSGDWYRSGPARSMIYRFHYWKGAMKAWAESPVIGLGGGNFRDAYMANKPPAALEDVDNAHNFALAALVEYGPLGALALVGLIGWIFAALVRVRNKTEETEVSGSNSPRLPVSPSPGRSLVLSVALITAAAVLLRTWLLWPGYGSLLLNLILLIAVPMLLLALPMLVLLLSRDRLAWPDDVGEGWLGLAIGCGLGGFLLACTIDFGMSQPGCAIAFWSLAAVAVAGKLQHAADPTAKKGRPAAVKRVIWAVAACLAATTTIVAFTSAYKPVRNSEQAMWRVATGQGLRSATLYVKQPQPASADRGSAGAVFEDSLVDEVLSADRWDPAGPSFMASRLLAEAETAGASAAIPQAVALFTEAHRRDPGDAWLALRLGDARLRLRQGGEEREATLRLMAAAADRLPHSVFAWRTYGESLLRAGRPALAADAFDHAKLADDTARLYDSKGLFTLSPGQLEHLQQRRAEAARATSRPGE
jgi:hypothetical protein